MTYKIYLKRHLDGKNHLFSLDNLILEILHSNGASSQPEIQKILRRPAYKNAIRNSDDGKITTLSREGLFLILKRLEKQTKIIKKLKGRTPIYQISPTTKLYAEFNGIQFASFFYDGMSNRNNELIDEFASSHNKKTFSDGLLQYFGFLVIAPLLASLQYKDEKLRSEWLKPVLNFENNPVFSKFNTLVPDEELKKMAEELSKKYPKNMITFREALKICRKMKSLREFGVEDLKLMKNGKDMSKTKFKDWSKEEVEKFKDKLKEKNLEELVSTKEKFFRIFADDFKNNRLK